MWRITSCNGAAIASNRPAITVRSFSLVTGSRPCKEPLVGCMRVPRVKATFQVSPPSVFSLLVLPNVLGQRTFLTYTAPCASFAVNRALCAMLRVPLSCACSNAQLASTTMALHLSVQSFAVLGAPSNSSSLDLAFAVCALLASLEVTASL